MYLPTEEELREEIETQKAIFYLQQKMQKRKQEESQMPKRIIFQFEDDLDYQIQAIHSTVELFRGLSRHVDGICYTVTNTQIW